MSEDLRSKLFKLLMEKMYSPNPSWALWVLDAIEHPILGPLIAEYAASLGQTQIIISELELSPTEEAIWTTILNSYGYIEREDILEKIGKPDMNRTTFNKFMEFIRYKIVDTGYTIEWRRNKGYKAIKKEQPMTDPLVAVATITADRKHAANYGIPHKLDYPNMAYCVNIETVPIVQYFFIRPSAETVAEIEKDPDHIPFHEGPDGLKYYTSREGNEPFNVVAKTARQPWVDELEQKIFQTYPRAYVDQWHVDSGWRPIPDYDKDQDQRRLLGIVTARNMARDFARHIGAEWLLFLDADVIVPPNSIHKLLEVADYTGRKLLGGVVPSRANNGTYYIFKPDPAPQVMPNFAMRQMIIDGYTPTKADVRRNGISLLGVQHATCGFMMIHHDIYEPLAFSLYSSTADDFYTDPETGQRNVGLSEDPLYGIEAQKWFGQRWLLRLDLKAEHLGELGPQETGVSYLDGRP